MQLRAQARAALSIASMQEQAPQSYVGRQKKSLGAL
jgi:hypothetical protein